MEKNLLSQNETEDSNKDENEIIYFSVNQEYNCIAIGTKKGFKIFSSGPFQLLYETNCGPINIVEMLYTTNLVLLVGLTETGNLSPKKITIWSTSEKIILCSSYPFSGKINVAKINKQRMVIGERNFLHIYSTIDMEILHTIDIGKVNLGKLVLSPNSDKNNWVCFSSSNDEGVVKVYDTLQLTMKVCIKAHKSSIFKMCLNFEGDKLATCSCKGTIIRIFSLPKGEKILTFKRGISSAFIFCLNFSLDSEKLISSSHTGILHIFDLKKENEEFEESKGLSKFFSRMFVNVAALVMPQDYEDSFGNQGASISFHEDLMKINNVVSFNYKNCKEAFCLTSDGYYYFFSVDYEQKQINKIYERNMKELKLANG